MGYSHKGICYPTEQQAETAYCESWTQTGLSSTGDLISSRCTGVSGGVATVERLNGATIATVNVPAPTFAPCEHDGGVSMALDYWYLALGFCAVLWGAKQLHNLFRGRHEVV